MATFPLKVLTMQGVAFEGEVFSLTLPTEFGPTVIEPGYTNFMAAISPAGVMKIINEEGTRYFAIFGGVVDVVKEKTKTTVYCEEINDGYRIDLARAMAARDRNLDRIKSNSEEIDMAKARAHLAKALVRISVKRLSEGEM